jgi:Xaa-Pro aminopeptidase
MALKTHGTMAVDWEQRIDFDRLRRERLARVKEGLAKSEMGALLCFDMNNVRYITSTNIGSWAQDKVSRFTLLPQNDEPILWDFGSAARHHQLNCPWLGERSRAGISLLRGAMSPEMGRAEDVAKKIRVELEMRGLHKEPLGVDIAEPPVLFALQREGITVVDGQQVLSDSRVIKTQDEIALLNTSAMMVEVAYHEAIMAMKPGMRENEAVGLVSKVLYDLGSEYVEAVNAISGERCNPHPHVFSDRVLRPGDPVYYDILHSFMGYRTCYYRCFAIGYASHALVDAYKRCREYLDAAIELVRPPHDRRDRFRVAEGAGIRLPERRGVLRAPSTATASGWPSGRSRSSAGSSRSIILTDQARHGIRARDLLAVHRWMERRAHRRRNRRHSHRTRNHHALSGRTAARLAGAHCVSVSGPISTTRRTSLLQAGASSEMIEASAKSEKVGASG